MLMIKRALQVPQNLAPEYSVLPVQMCPEISSRTHLPDQFRKEFSLTWGNPIYLAVKKIKGLILLQL
jgi:hypothetical protein